VSLASLSIDSPLLDPDTIIAVCGDERGLHAEPPPRGWPAPGGFFRPAFTGLPADGACIAPPSAGSVRFKIRVANSEGRRRSASYLIQRMYAWRGYKATGPQAAPNRVTLVASDGDHALATISIGFDSTDGLLVDDLYHDEIQSLRADKARICEFTKLAVDRNEQSREVLAMMFHIAYMYARRLHRCTDLLIEVNPRHVRFYRAMLGFEVLGPERSCPRVNAPAVLLRLRLEHAQEQLARYGGHRELAATVRSLYPLGFSAEEENGICGRLRELA